MSALAKLTMITSNAVSLDRLDHRVRDAGGGHLRRQVVGRHLLRRHQRAVFPAERLLDAAVEEVSDVRVLLRLRDAQVAQVGLRHQVRQQVVHRLRRNDDRAA